MSSGNLPDWKMCSTPAVRIAAFSAALLYFAGSILAQTAGEEPASSESDQPVAEQALPAEPSPGLLFDPELVPEPGTVETTPFVITPDASGEAAADVEWEDGGEFATEEAAASEEEQTTTAEPVISAGPGYRGFYEFGQLPGFLSRVGLLDVPGSGGQLANRTDERLNKIGPFRYGGSVTGGVSYSDNVFGSSDNRQGDAIWTLTPTLFVETGNTANVKLLYSPSLQQYTTNSSLSSINQTALLSFDVPFYKLGIGGGLGYTRREGVFSDSNGFATQSTYGGNLFANYQIAHRTLLGLAYDFTIQESDPGGPLFDNSVEASVNYQIGPRTVVRAFVRPGYTSGDNDQSYVSAGVGGSYFASRRLQMFGNAAMEVRTLSDSSDVIVSPVFDGGVAWSPVDWMQLRGSLFRSIGNNSFNTSQTQISTGGGIGASFLLWRKLTIGVDARYAYTELDSSADDALEEDYDYSSLSGFVSYPLTHNIYANAFYSYSVRGLSVGTNNYDQSSYGVSLSVLF